MRQTFDKMFRKINLRNERVNHIINIQDEEIRKEENLHQWYIRKTRVKKITEKKRALSCDFKLAVSESAHGEVLLNV